MSKSERFVKLRSMPCWDEVEERLRAGFPVSQLVTFIQETKGEYQHVTSESLRVMLYDYRKTMSPMEVAQTGVPKFTSKALEQIETNIDELNELGRLYMIQKGRLESGVKLEASMGGFLNQNIDRAVRQATEILLKRAELKLKLGLFGAERPTDEEEEDRMIPEVYGPGLREVMEDAASRGKVLSLARHVAKMRGLDEEDVEEVLAELSGDG